MHVPVKCALAATSALAALVTAGGSACAEDADTRFMLAGGLLVPTVLQVDGEFVAADPGPLFLISFDRHLSEDSALDWGGFLDVGSFSAGESDEQVNLMQVGASLHWRRPGTWGGVFRLGGRLGYRQLFADARGFDAVRGVALDFSTQFVKAIGPNLTGQIELGLMAQPVGGNANGLVYFGPFPFLALGVVF
jgi:hypothetical protein